MRLLLVSENAAFLDEKSAERAWLLEHTAVAAETYLIVLTPKGQTLMRTELAPHVWLYSTDSRFGFERVADAVRVAESIPTVDLVVSECEDRPARAATRIAAMRRVPYLVQVTQKSVDPERLRGFFGRRARRHLQQLLAEATAVQVDALATEDRLRNLKLLRGKQVSYVPAIGAPRQEAVHEATPAQEEENHPELRFKVCAPLTERARLTRGNVFEVFDELAAIYPWVGLLVLGTERTLKRARRAAHTHRGGDRVFFRLDPGERDVALVVSQALLMTESSQVDHELLRRAAAAGTPVVLPEGVASDKIQPGVQALVCAPHDTACFVRAMRELIENNATRLRLEVALKAAYHEPTSPGEDRVALLRESYRACAAREMT